MSEPTKINLNLGTWSKSYTLVATNSDDRYDYSYVIPLFDNEEQNRNDRLRYLLIPDDSVNYQTDRYFSGLYWGRPSDDLDVGTIQDRLYKRLFNRLEDVI